MSILDTVNHRRSIEFDSKKISLDENERRFNTRENSFIERERRAKQLICDSNARFDALTIHYGEQEKCLTDLKNEVSTLFFKANYDALTKLPNRQLFDDRLQMMFNATDRRERSICVLFMDLDKFKEVNDAYGHKVGDILLHKVANRLLSGFRASDTVARYGGDEFLVLFNPPTTQSNATVLIRIILQVMSKPFFIDGLTLNISISVGASFHGDIDNIISNADTAMYESKKKGGNTFTFFEP